MNEIVASFFDLNASVRANLPRRRFFGEKVKSWQEDDAYYSLQLARPWFSKKLVTATIDINPKKKSVPVGTVKFDINPIGWSPSNISDFIALRSSIGGVKAYSSHHLSEPLPVYRSHLAAECSGKIVDVNEQLFSSCIGGLDEWIGCNDSSVKIQPYKGDMSVRELLHAFFLSGSDYDVQSIKAEHKRLGWLFNDSGERTDFIDALLELKEKGQNNDPNKKVCTVDYDHKYIAAGNTGDYLFTVETLKSKTKLNEFSQGTVILKYFRDGFESDYGIVKMHFHPMVNTLEMLPSTYRTETMCHYLSKEDIIPGSYNWCPPEYLDKAVVDDLRTRANAGYDLLKGWAKSVVD